jgi:hypothetical protein
MSKQRAAVEDWFILLSNVTTVIELAIYAGTVIGHSAFVCLFLCELASDALREIESESVHRMGTRRRTSRQHRFAAALPALLNASVSR